METEAILIPLSFVDELRRTSPWLRNKQPYIFLNSWWFDESCHKSPFILLLSHFQIKEKGLLDYFVKNKIDQTATCKVPKCGTELKISNRGTTSLHRHLSLLGITIKKITCTSQINPQSTIDQFFGRKESLDGYMARLVEKAKIPYVRHTAPELHEIYHLKGFSNLPKFANTVREKVVRFAKGIRENNYGKDPRTRNAVGHIRRMVFVYK